MSLFICKVLLKQCGKISFPGVARRTGDNQNLQKLPYEEFIKRNSKTQK